MQDQQLWGPFIARAERFMDRVEAALRLDIEQPDWDSAIAFRYRKRVSGQGYIGAVRQVGAMRLDDLKEIDIQKEKIRRNTEQFVQGKTANNVLLTGARGTGKSSLVRACLNTYSGQGLRGYGKLVIIKHNKTFLSAYAHNSNILVKEGQSVTRGQRIAEIGNTDSDSAKLHFEIRRFGKPTDPIKFLPAR